MRSIRPSSNTNPRVRRPSARARAAQARVRLARLVARFPGARVLVIGDLMLDRFVRGDVRRISPEAPVPVVQVRTEGVHPGGAGNVVANLAALEARPSVVGWTGRDFAGHELRRLLRDLGADTAGIVGAPDAVTIEKTRVVAHAQQVVRLDREPTRPGPRLERLLLASAARALDGADAVLVSDYGKGTIWPGLLELLAERRARDGFLYLIDPKPANFPHYRGATLVKPNELETAAATGVDIADEAALAAAGDLLLERWRSEAILISRGEHGMSLFCQGQAPRHLPTAAREVFDVTGAGDTVMAVAALALAAGGTLEEAAWLANVAAGVVVGKVGTATLGARELLHAVDLALLEGAEPPTPARRPIARRVRSGRAR